MSEQPTPTPPPESSGTQNVSGGVTVQPGGDANVGGDVVGRDKVTQTTTNVTNVGMGPEAVRRLVITVGVLVFVTALCFFSGGILVGATALRAFDRPINSTVSAAQDFQSGLNEVKNLSAGRSFQWTYAETDLSSYTRFFLGPKLGSNWRARLLPNGEVAFQGNWSGMLGLPVTVVTRMEPNSPQLYHTTGAMVQVITVSNSDFGWVALPAFVVQPLVDAINQDIGGFTASLVTPPPFVASPDGELAPPSEAPLQITGTK